MITSPLLREVELAVPKCGGLRLPMALWAVIVGMHFHYGATKREELTRAREAARWLASLSPQHGDVIAVTHGAVRRYIADAFVADGWRVVYPRKKKWAPWSAWEIVRND